MKTLKALIIAFFLLVVPIAVSAKEQIDSFDVTIAISPDGSIGVSEQIGYDFGDLTRHGIYRDIPYIKTNDLGKRFAIDFSNVSITDDKGVAYQFIQSIENDDVRWTIGDPDKTITGKHTYLMSYVAKGALTYFSGHDELYWNAVGTRWPVPVAAASVRVMLPSQAPKDNLHVECFTGEEESTERNCTTSIIGDREIEVAIIEPLDSYEGLTIVVGFPKGLVAVLEPRELVPFFDTLLGKIVLVILGIGAFLWYVVAPIFVVRKWWMSGRDPKPPMGEANAWFSPPKNQEHRELTPAETGTLVDERADLRDIYASIVDLARRGYLTMTMQVSLGFQAQRGMHSPKSREAGRRLQRLFR